MINYDYLYNKEYYGEKLNQNHLYDKKLNFQIIKNGTVLPYKPPITTAWGFGGIVDDQGNFCKGSFVNNEGVGAYTPNEEIKFIPNTVIYLGMLVGVWGHSITDNLKHAWFFNSEVYRKSFKNCPIVYNPWLGYIYSQSGGIMPNLLKLFQYLEIDISRLIPITKPTKFQNIILPDESFFGIEDNRKFFTNEYVETIDRIRNFASKNFTEISQKKFYFFHGRGQIGEERIAEYFKDKGYSIIRPENCPLEEQLNILSNCTDFVSTLGSCAHNMIFMHDNSNVTFIPRTLADNVHQLPLNQIHSMNINYVDSALSIFQKNSYGPFCYIISKQLKKFFGENSDEKYNDEDFIIFLQYVKYSLKNGLKENIELKKYYSGFMKDFINQLKEKKDLMEKIGVFIK